MQKANYPPVPAFAVIGNVLPTLQPFFEFIAFLSRPENAKVLRQAREDSERFFREQDRALLAFAVNSRWIGLGAPGNPVEGERDSGGNANSFFGVDKSFPIPSRCVLAQSRRMRMFVKLPKPENPHFIAASSASATSFLVWSSISDGPALTPASLAKRLFLIPI